MLVEFQEYIVEIDKDGFDITTEYYKEMSFKKQ